MAETLAELADAPDQPAWCDQGSILRPGEQLQRRLRVQFRAAQRR